MLVDLNDAAGEMPDGQYDVCVCGTGPAGITLALTLAKAGLHVALLEGGDRDLTDASQELYKGKSVGYQYWEAVSTCRLRYLGGSSNHWSGRCSFFDNVDFEPRRDLGGLPGWQIAREDLFQWFTQAQEVLDIPKNQFERNRPSTKWQGEAFRYSEFAYSAPTRFGSKYFKELKDSKNITLFLNANLTDIRVVDSADAVLLFEVKNYKKRKFIFRARNYVLALGALENARALLNSDSQVPGGIGNQGGMVGRCFMEHLDIELGRFVIENASFWENGRLQLNPSESFLRAHDVGNGVLAFNNNADVKSYGRLKALKQFAREAVCRSNVLTEVMRRFQDFTCPGDGVITTLIEQAPNLKSRVILDSERDQFGLRRLILDWQLSPVDYKTIRVLGTNVAKEMAKLGVSRVQLKEFMFDSLTDNIRGIGGHCHQMGTTRMSSDHRSGVVDKHLKVHGIDNLYIAGSSVFPTGGGCNPTFTVVMLALRLGNYLSQLK